MTSVCPHNTERYVMKQTRPRQGKTKDRTRQWNIMAAAIGYARKECLYWSTKEIQYKPDLLSTINSYWNYRACKHVLTSCSSPCVPCFAGMSVTVQHLCLHNQSWKEKWASGSKTFHTATLPMEISVTLVLLMSDYRAFNTIFVAFSTFTYHINYR